VRNFKFKAENIKRKLGKTNIREKLFSYPFKNLQDVLEKTFLGSEENEKTKSQTDETEKDR
jgi:hypothetical protein